MAQEMRLRNYSERTINTYISLLRNCGKKLQKNPGDITGEEIKDYLYFRITKEKVSTSTINQTIGAFKMLNSDILGRNWEDLKIKRPRREKKLPKVLSRSEIQEILNVVSNLKHKCIISLAYSTGLRKEEVQNLRLKDVDSSRMAIYVSNGKGRKSRYVNLSSKLLDLLRIYIKLESPVHYLFESRLEKGKKLSSSTLNRIVKNNVEKTSIKKNISFHTLRHCYATHSLEDGVNLKLLQLRLGHSSLSVTSEYLHVANMNITDKSTLLDTLDL